MNEMSSRKIFYTVYVQQTGFRSCQLMTTIALDFQLILRVHDPLTPPLHDYDQRFTLRDGLPSTVACPACWEMGTKELKRCMVRKKIFFSGPTIAAYSIQKSLVPARQFQRTNKETLFHLYSLSPHLPQIQQSAGPPLPSLSGCI